MAKILISGNELGDYRAEGWTEFSGSPTTTVNQLGGRRTPQLNGGRYYFYLNASIGLNQIAKVLPNVATGAASGGYSEVYVRFAYNGQSNRTTRQSFAFRNSNTGLIVGSLYHIDTGGGANVFVQARNGAGSSLGQSIQAFDNSQWRRIEIRFKCAASGGIWEVYVDDVLFLNLTGLNTSNGATTVFDQVIIGQVDNGGILNWWDDIVVHDTTGTVNNGRVGEGVVLALYPARAGTFSQLRNAYNTTVENYDHVNKPVQDSLLLSNNSLYVGTNIAGDKDTYKGPSLPLEIGGIGGLKVVMNAVRNGAGITNAKAIVSPGVRAPNAPPTVGAPSAGGLGTDGTHVFATVNKIGLGYSLPSLPSTVLTLGGGNNQATLTVPVSSSSLVTSREVYASKAGQNTTIAAGSNGALLPQSTINVVDTTNFPASGSIYLVTTNGLVKVDYSGKTGTSFTGCTGGSGTMSTGGAVLGTLFLIGTIADNVTTAFNFSVADGSFGATVAPFEAISANLPLPNGAFGYIESIFNNDPVTGLAWTRDHIEEVEFGEQFVA